VLLKEGHQHFVAPLYRTVLNALKSICSSNAINVTLSALPDPQLGLQNIWFCTHTHYSPCIQPSIKLHVPHFITISLEQLDQPFLAHDVLNIQTTAQ
jgi:hypothetical protein